MDGQWQQQEGVRIGKAKQKKRRQPTFVGEYGCQLGEFLLFSPGDISDSGRGRELAIFLEGEEVGVFLEIRSG